MGYELRRWLRDQLPKDCTPSERLVALEIADFVRDEPEYDRRPKPGVRLSLDDLATWTGLKNTKSVGQALHGLAGRGWEFRVPIAHEDDGTSVFTRPGRSLDFRVPECAGPIPTHRSAKRRTKRSVNERTIRPDGATTGPSPDGPVVPEQTDHSPSPDGPQLRQVTDPTPPTPGTPKEPPGSDSLRSSAREAEETITEEETAPEDREPEQVIEVEAEPSTARRYHKATETERAEVRAFIDRNKPAPSDPVTDPGPLALCRCGVPYGRTGVHHDLRHPRHHPFRREAA